jgi:hypothetical protein
MNTTEAIRKLRDVIRRQHKALATEESNAAHSRSGRRVADRGGRVARATQPQNTL